MILRYRTIVAATVMIFIGLLTAIAKSESASSPVKVIEIIGLTGVKQNTKGALSVEDGHLHFASTKASADIKTELIEDVVTGADSQVAVGNTIHMISMAAPYESGRFLSLFRTKIDTLTVEYRDGNGGLHGAIFTMPAGVAGIIKNELVAQGAHTNAISESNAIVAPSDNSPSKEQRQ